jgi:hypothetical protein
MTSLTMSERVSISYSVTTKSIVKLQLFVIGLYATPAINRRTTVGLSALIQGRNSTHHPLLQKRQMNLQICRESFRNRQRMFAVAIGSEAGRNIHTNEQERLLLPESQYQDRQSGVVRQSASARRLLFGVLSSIPTVLGYLRATDRPGTGKGL